MASYTAYSVTPSGYVVNLSSLVDVNDDYIIFTTDDNNQYIFYGEIDFTQTTATGIGTLTRVYRTSYNNTWYWNTQISDNVNVTLNFSDATRNYIYSNSGYTNTVTNTNQIRSNQQINYTVLCIFAFVTIAAVISEALRSKRGKKYENPF